MIRSLQCLFRIIHPGRLAASVLVLAVVSGCSHSTASTNQDSWAQQIVNYRQTLATDHPDQIQTVLSISDEMRDEVATRFSLMQKHQAARGIAEWLLDENGHNMRYDIAANLSPKQAYAQRRGNCLSFTLLLVALAKSIDIEIEFNAVDIPDTWGMDDEMGMVFYRHVNGVLSSFGKRQIFDLAMELYDTGYPQRFISREQAMALYLNNLAIDLLHQEKFEAAIHPLKLAISYSPNNPDLWTNLGVVMKRNGKLQLAERAFHYAIQLDKSHIPAVSNLERIYLEQGKSQQALMYKKQADRARKKNPYYHYRMALDNYRNRQFRKASKATKYAILLHNKDPRFFELQSHIAQQQHKYKLAIKSLKRAYEASISQQQRGKYIEKATLVSQRASEDFAKRWGKNTPRNNTRLLQFDWF